MENPALNPRAAACVIHATNRKKSIIQAHGFKKQAPFDGFIHVFAYTNFSPRFSEFTLFGFRCMMYATPDFMSHQPLPSSRPQDLELRIVKTAPHPFSVRLPCVCPQPHPLFAVVENEYKHSIHRFFSLPFHPVARRVSPRAPGKPGTRSLPVLLDEKNGSRADRMDALIKRGRTHSCVRAGLKTNRRASVFTPTPKSL